MRDIGLGNLAGGQQVVKMVGFDEFCIPKDIWRQILTQILILTLI